VKTRSDFPKKSSTKRLVQVVLYVQMAVAILVGMMLAAGTVSASPAEAATLVPFAATYQEQVVFVSCPPGTPPTTVCAHVLGVGQATHLGELRR
jgi:hypothetical protein